MQPIVKMVIRLLRKNSDFSKRVVKNKKPFNQYGRFLVFDFINHSLE